MASVVPERFVINRTPRDDDELWWTVQALWGIKIPRTPVCPDHVPPFQAFADAYFARHPVTVWKACVPGDVAVLTVSGPVRADQVTPGTEVWSFDGTPVRAKVTDTWASGEQPILTIRTRAGDLRCTGNHVVLVGRGIGWRKYEQQWVRADEIVPGDMLIRAHGYGTDAADDDEDIDLAELAGLVLSDGSVQRHKLLIAHHVDAGYMAHYIEVIERMFGKPVRADPKTRCTWLHSTDAANTLLQLGLGGTAHTKRVPGWVFDLGRDGKLAFLRGYLDGDGTVRKDGVEYFSCNEWMMHDLRHLAMMIGLRVGRVTYQATSGECVVGGRVVQRGDMYSVRVYSNEIGSHDPKYTFRDKAELKPIYSGDGWVGQRVLGVDHGPAEQTYDIEVEGPESFICDGYVVHNSRGYGGKSYLLAVLSATEMCMLGADVNLLGGSGAQSINIHSHTQEMWSWVNAPRALLSKEPTRLDTWTTNGGHIRSLTASQTSVRGPHPQRLRLDEIDEMDMDILEAAQGQPMRKRKASGIIETQTVMSSTHQYPDRTMSQILARAKNTGWPVYHWCYRETSNPEDGWLTQDEVNRKRQEIPAHMWDTEYELQEPNFDNRAIDPELVAKAFSPLLGETQGDSIVVLDPDQVTAGMRFVTGVDWAKKRDSTIIATYLIEPGSPNDIFRCIAWQRLGKRPWPEMVRAALKQWFDYGGRLIHDATGVGDVVDDLIMEYVTDTYLRKLITPYIMTGGAKRSALFSEYVAAVERTEIVHPRVWYAYDEHRYMTDDDLFGQGHPPDSVVAASLAWSLRDRRQAAPLLALPVGYTQSNQWHL